MAKRPEQWLPLKHHNSQDVGFQDHDFLLWFPVRAFLLRSAAGAAAIKSIPSKSERWQPRPGDFAAT
jgi:hypothetical protein